MATSTGLVSGSMAGTQAATNVNTSGQPVDYSALIQNLYKTNLNRDAEQAGVDFYNKQLQSGANLEDIKKDIVNSSEYKTLHEKQAALDGAKDYYAQTYKPTNWEVGANQTVQGQLASATDPNSQINQRAIAQAQQDASKRGLINSSIAGSAAQAAVLDKALPIAQQDASTYASSAQTNAAAANTAGQFNANAQNQFGLQGMQNQSAQNIANANNASAQAIANLNSNTQLALGNLDADTKTKLQNIVSQNSQLLQTNTSAANAVSQLMASIATIQANDKLDAAAKAQAISNLTATMQESLKTFAAISGLNIDLSKYFVVDNATLNPNNQTQPDVTP